VIWNQDSTTTRDLPQWPRYRVDDSSRRSAFPIPLLLLILAGSGVLTSTGCAVLGENGKPLVPTRYQVRTGPFRVLSDSPLDADSEPVRCLGSLEQQLTKGLGLETQPDVPPIDVFILNDRDSFAHFLQFYYPELPSRRAFFLAQGDSRVVYTYASPKLDVDLRHEATHALLHARYGRLPLWLDEGLAEFFESADIPAQDQHDHVDRFPTDLAEGWKPNLARLEELNDVREMSPRDYRESWAWIHLMLEEPGPNRSLLLGYLDRISRADSLSGPSLTHELDASGTRAETLLAHLETIRARPIAQQSRERETDPVVRLQDPAVERASNRSSSLPARSRSASSSAASMSGSASRSRPPSPPAPRGIRGFFNRIGNLFGL
jgi:hypothetical protein